jgi:hypothetical protein
MSLPYKKANLPWFEPSKNGSKHKYKRTNGVDSGGAMFDFGISWYQTVEVYSSAGLVYLGYSDGVSDTRSAHGYRSGLVHVNYLVIKGRVYLGN